MQSYKLTRVLPTDPGNGVLGGGGRKLERASPVLDRAGLAAAEAIVTPSMDQVG